jgi:N-formylmaleamate deformylase
LSKWSEGTLTANGIQFHYYRPGGDKPSVVMNHGAGEADLCWTRVAKELQKDYDLILPDARGHGKSASGKGAYSTGMRVADLSGLIRELKLDRPVVGGHSMGADSSMHLAAENPDIVRGVFLEDPPIILPGEKFGNVGKPVNPSDIGRLMAKVMRMFKRLPRFIGVLVARRGPMAYTEEDVNSWIDSKKRLSEDFLQSMPTIEMDLSAPFEAFKKISVPVLLIIGDKEKMSIVSQETAQEAARVNPKVQVVHLAGASHDIRRTRFDGYLPALKNFLAEIYR